MDNSLTARNPASMLPVNSSISLAAKRASLLIGCYRKTDATDPEIYTRAVVAVLARYPESVVMAVTEPATGLASKLKWLPAIAEIVEACDLEMGPILRARRRELERAEQQRLRLAAPTERKLTTEEIETKLGRKLGSFVRRI